MKPIIIVLLILNFAVATLSQDKNKIDSLQKILQNTTEDKHRADILNQISWNYINYDLDAALNFADEALKLSQKITYKEGIALAYSHLAYSYHRKGNYELALTTINKAVGIYEVLGDKAKLAQNLLTISQIYYAQSKFQKAVEYCESSIKLKKEINEIKSLELNYLTLGVIYQSLGYYDSAIENLMISVDLCIKNNNTVSLASNYNNIAVVYKKQNNNNLALEYYKKAVDMHKKNGNKLGEAQALNNIAVVYEVLQQFDTAIEFYNKAYNIFIEMGYKSGECTALTNIAGIEISQKKLSKVPQKLAKALKLANEMDDKYRMISIHGLWGQYYLEQKMFTNSINHSIKALELAKELSTITLYTDLALQVACTYESFAYHKEALEYYKIYHQNYDSIYNIKKSEIIEKLTADFQLKEKEGTLTLQAKEIEILEKNKKLNTFRTITLLIAVFLLVLVVLTMFFIHSRKIKNQKIINKKNLEISESEKQILELKLKNQQIAQNALQEELEYKNREIQNFALHIIDKNDFIENIKQSLKETLMKVSEANNNQEIQKIINSINNKMLLEREREEFLAYIDQINNNFYLNLKNKYPELTETETRIASLLRMNFSSKDISAILHITPKSVDTNRYRIRKKVGIELDTKLSEFFKNI